jgi:hypothetical protein
MSGSRFGGIVRKTVLFLISIVTPAAFACPQIGGRHVCLIDNAVQDFMTIDHEVRDGKHVFTKGSTEMIADNTIYALPDQEYIRNRAKQAYCEGDESLTAIEIGQVFEDTELLFSYQNKDVYQMLGDGKFEMLLSNRFTYPDGKIVEYKAYVLCEPEPAK